MTILIQENDTARQYPPSQEHSLRRCRSCGEAIDPARIEAIPRTNTCVECQTQIEMGQNGSQRHFLRL